MSTTAGPVGPDVLPPSPLPERGRGSGPRLSPQALVLVATLAIASRPLKGAIIAGVFWWWGDTYQQVEFVMDQAQVNEGAPYIDGHLNGESAVTRLTGMMVGERVAPDGAPGEVFAPGKRLLIWQSRAAPDFGEEGASVNRLAVVSRPELPGLAAVLSHLAMTIATLAAGRWAMAWTGRWWARRAGPHG